MAITRRSHKAAGGGHGGGSAHASSSFRASLRTTLARLNLSTWVVLAAVVLMGLTSFFGMPRGSHPGMMLSSSYVLSSPTSRKAMAPKLPSKPCSSSKLATWPLGVEFTRAKSDAGVKCLEYAYTVRV